MSVIPKRFLNRDQTGLIELANRGLDIFGCLLATLAIGLTDSISSGQLREWVLLALIQTLATLLSFQQSGLYRSWRGRPFSDQFSRLILAWVVATATTWIVWLTLRLDGIISAEGVLFWLLLSLLIIAVQRAFLFSIVRALRRRGDNFKNVVIYGAGTLGRSIATQSAKSPESGFRIVGFLDDNPALTGQRIDGIEVRGNLANLEGILSTQTIHELWLALPLAAMERAATVLEVSNRQSVSIRMFPDLYGLTLLNHSVSELLGFPIIDLNVNQMQGINRLLKAIEDKFLGLLFFLLALPLIGVIAVAVKLTSEGPVLFKQRRIGWDGKPFTIYKFRTMMDHQEKAGIVTQATRNDPRFTAVGRWLRRTSLDELPQLYNVLQGRMSLVGPRPHAMEHDHIYERQIEGYMRRNRVKPGITGWAQINDLRGEVQHIEEMVRRVKHDLYYIEHWSLWFDLRIIIATILKLFFSKKAW